MTEDMNNSTAEDVKDSATMKDSASAEMKNSTDTHNQSRKDGWVYPILLLFLGYTGAHRFYLGKIGMGIAYFFTLGFLGVGVLVDAIVVIINRVRDKNRASMPIETGARVFVVLVSGVTLLSYLIIFSLIGTVGIAIDRGVHVTLFENATEALQDALFEYANDILQDTPLGDAVGALQDTPFEDVVGDLQETIFQDGVESVRIEIITPDGESIEAVIGGN